MSEEITTAPENLSMVTVAKNDMVETLAQMNKQLTETITVPSKENEKLLQIIDKLM